MQQFCWLSCKSNSYRCYKYNKSYDNSTHSFSMEHSRYNFWDILDDNNAKYVSLQALGNARKVWKC